MELKNKKEPFSSLIAQIGTILIFSVYPLLMTNKYYNITSSKYIFFCFVSAICLMLCLIIQTVKTDFTQTKSVISRIKQQITPADILVLIFAVVSVISCLSSDYFIAALGGGQGRQMGLMMNLSLTFAYFFISKFYIIRNKDFYPMGIALVLVCALALVQFIGYDPFGLIATLSSVRRNTFLSTIGNMNVYASYICIVSSISMYLFCFESKKTRSVFWLIISCVGYFGLFTSNSDSGYIGIGVALVIIFILSTKSDTSFKKIWILILSFFVVAAIFKILSIIYADFMRQITFLTRVATSTYVITGGFFISATVLYIMKQYNPSQNILKKIKVISVSTVTIGIAAFVFAFIYFSFINTDISLGSFEHYLRFNENWGTGRGDIWTKALEAFSELPLSKKLFGAGEDTFALLLSDKLGYSEIRIGRSYYDNAHSEFIQHLLSIGILGLASYLMLAFYAIKATVKAETTIQKAMLIPILSFLIQSSVNILQPITSPFIFVLFALTQCKTTKE